MDPDRLLGTTKVNTKAMTWHESLDALKTSARTRQGEKREDLVDASPVGLGRDQPGCQECRDLGSKQEPIFGSARLASPVKRTDCEPVPGEDQHLATLIPQSQSKLPPKLIEH